jgi:hypothetical protein
MWNPPQNAEERYSEKRYVVPSGLGGGTPLGAKG